MTPPETLSRSPEATKARYAISVVFFVFGELVGAWIPHIPDVKRSLHATNTELGSALLSSGIGAVAIVPFVGALIHRFGSKRLSIATSLGCCAVSAMLVRHTSMPGLVINLLSLGILFGVLDVSMNAHSVAVQRLFDRPVLSAIHGWFCIGGFVGSLGAAVAASRNLDSSWHLAINSSAMGTLVLAASAFLLQAGIDKDVAGPKFILPHGLLLLIGLLCSFAFIVEGAMYDWVALFLRGTLKATSELGAFGAGAVSLAMAIGRLGGDSVIHRLGARKVVWVGSSITVVGLLVAVGSPYTSVSIMGFGVAALGLSNAVPILFNASGNIDGVPAATGLASVTTLGYAGFIFGPPTIGYLSDLVSLRFAMALLAVLAFAITVLGPRCVRRQHKALQTADAIKSRI